MKRRIPVPADVRIAIDDARRAMEAAAKPVPPESRVEWIRANGECRFCGEEQDVLHPVAAARGRPDAIRVCARTLAELVALPAAPSGPDAIAILDTLARWMAPQAGEPAAAEWSAPPDPCSVCGRAAGDVAQLAAGDGIALCFDCASHAAGSHADPPTRDEIAAFEIEQARQEVDDLARIRREVRNDPGVRRNATAALSLVRLLCVPDPSTRERLRELVSALDA